MNRVAGLDTIRHVFRANRVRFRLALFQSDVIRLRQLAGVPAFGESLWCVEAWACLLRGRWLCWLRLWRDRGDRVVPLILPRVVPRPSLRLARCRRIAAKMVGDGVGVWLRQRPRQRRHHARLGAAPARRRDLGEQVSQVVAPQPREVAGQFLDVFWRRLPARHLARQFLRAGAIGVDLGATLTGLVPRLPPLRAADRAVLVRDRRVELLPLLRVRYPLAEFGGLCWVAGGVLNRVLGDETAVIRTRMLLLVPRLAEQPPDRLRHLVARHACQHPRQCLGVAVQFLEAVKDRVPLGAVGLGVRDGFEKCLIESYWNARVVTLSNSRMSLKCLRSIASPSAANVSGADAMSVSHT